MAATNTHCDWGHPADCTFAGPNEHAYVSAADQVRRLEAARQANARFALAAEQAAEARRRDVATAHRMRAEGSILFEIAQATGRSKEWLREYAGAR